MITYHNYEERAKQAKLHQVYASMKDSVRQRLFAQVPFVERFRHHEQLILQLNIFEYICILEFSLRLYKS